MDFLAIHLFPTPDGSRGLRKLFEEAVRADDTLYVNVDLRALEDETGFVGYHHMRTQAMWVGFVMAHPKVTFTSWYEEFHNCFREYGEAAKDIARQAFDGARGA